MIIKEEKYIETMKKKVEPQLAARREEIWLENQPGRMLYCVHYRAEMPKGTILISHGFTETVEKYLECIYYFLQMSLNVFCIDHCGHGKSYRLTEDLSLVHIDRYERYVEDLIFTAEYAKERYKNQPLFLYGHSMGGGIAAAAAAKRSELFAKLILSSPMIRPETEPVPWILAKNLARVFCISGKETNYVTGQSPYQGPGHYEDSASASRVRFDYYEGKRYANPRYQMNAPSYGWLFQAARLNTYLMTKGWKHIRMPVLVFLAQQEKFVSNQEIGRFVEKVRRCTKVEQVKMKNAKHEIYNSEESVQREYWKRISMFLKES